MCNARGAAAADEVWATGRYNSTQHAPTTLCNYPRQTQTHTKHTGGPHMNTIAEPWNQWWMLYIQADTLPQRRHKPHQATRSPQPCPHTQNHAHTHANTHTCSPHGAAQWNLPTHSHTVYMHVHTTTQKPTHQATPAASPTRQSQPR
jgi:hypothetical protein